MAAALTGGFSAPLRRLFFKLAYWGVLWLSAFTVLHIVAPVRFPFFAHKVRRIDDRAIELWSSYISHHPVQPYDRYAFREVGFRAHVYAELLRRHAEEEVNALSEVLWRFVPGIFDVREHSKQRFTVTGTPLPLREGIVTVVHPDTALAALHSISTLRYSLYSRLPVELYHYGEAELPLPLRRALESLPSVSTIDLSTITLFDTSMEDDAGNIPNGPNSQAREAMAMLATTFQRVILASPDVTWLADPATLFTQRGFEATGTFLFRGRGLPASPQSQRMVTWLKEQYDHSWPSPKLATLPFWDYVADNVITPQVAAFDKSRAGVFSALLFNAWMQTKPVKDEVWGRYPTGQRQSLFLAFELSNMPYHSAEATPGAIGTFTGSEWQGQGNEEQSICAARAMHFASPPRSSFSGPASSTPLWLDQGILENSDREVYMNATAWAMHGRWEKDKALGKENSWCFTGATLRNVEDLHLQGTLSSIQTVVRRTTGHFRPLFALFALVPQPVVEDSVVEAAS